MAGWLKLVLVALVVMVGLWGLLVVLAARVPFKAKAAVVLAGLWVLSPVDLLPEFLPVIGPLDDVVVVALALRYAARRVPREVLLEAWPGEPRLLERLLGTSAPAKQPAEPQAPNDAPGSP
jgi:uncharacterized membrane protein YkvA (DUF1232 family)